MNPPRESVRTYRLVGVMLALAGVLLLALAIWMLIAADNQPLAGPIIILGFLFATVYVTLGVLYGRRLPSLLERLAELEARVDRLAEDTESKTEKGTAGKAR